MSNERLKATSETNNNNNGKESVNRSVISLLHLSLLPSSSLSLDSRSYMVMLFISLSLGFPSFQVSSVHQYKGWLRFG